MQVSRTSSTLTVTRGLYKNVVTADEGYTQHKERSTTMGLSWQQGPLSGQSVGRFLTPERLPDRMLFAEPLRRRLRVKLADEWIADSEEVPLLHEPGRYCPQRTRNGFGPQTLPTRSGPRSGRQ
jgi:hypothetical protein